MRMAERNKIRREIARSFSYAYLKNQVEFEQGRIHGYLSRARLGRGSNEVLLASKQQNTRSKIDVTDGSTDGQTDGPTYMASY